MEPLKDAHQTIVDNWPIIAAENRRQSDFVNAYILEHFGEFPSDPIEAQSAALAAFYKSIGADFGPNDETFVIPDFNE